MRSGTGQAPDPELQAAIQRGYETRDITIGPLIKWLSGLFVFTSLSAVITFGIYVVLSPIQTDDNTKQLTKAQNRFKPEPLLQADPEVEIKTFRSSEDSSVLGYGKDEKTKKPHIPVERAMDIVAEKGIPIPTATDAKPTDTKPTDTQPTTPEHKTGE